MGLPRDQGLARGSTHQHEHHSLSRAVQWPPHPMPDSRMSPNSQHPMKVTAPESTALVLDWDSEPYPVVGRVWIRRTDTLQEQEKVPFAVCKASPD